VSAKAAAVDRGAGVSVAVISYNTRDILRRCLASVVAEHPTEVVVADNGSSDGSVEMVRSEFPAARLLVDAGNPGYGAASNRAIEGCTSPYVLLLNADTLLPPRTLSALLGYMESHPRVGLAGPRLRNADGSLQRSCYAFPSTSFLLVEHSPLRPLAALLPSARRHFFIGWPHDRARAVPWVLGAALMIRRDAFDAVGGFDPSFHMYYEEVDLAYRLAAAGWETHFTPIADVTHLGGASTSAVWMPMKVRNFRSLVQFGATHFSAFALIRLIATLNLLVLVKLALDAVQRTLASDPERRRALGERVTLWRRVAAVGYLREALAVRKRARGLRHDPTPAARSLGARA
jgi:N-acetylglucosaminyl-diphospho-decaprenol L-rhamnosyltransferase